MKIASLILILFLCSHISIAQWNINGSIIENTNSGDVVIKSGSHLRIYSRFVTYYPKSDTPLSGEILGTSGWWGFRTGTDNTFHLDIYNANSPKSAFSINQSGNVGIGTNPSQKLHLLGTSSTWLNIDKVGDGNEAGVLFSKAGSTLFYLYNDDANNALKIQASGLSGELDATPRMQFPLSNKNIYMAESGGNVGIGTNSPGSFKLAVEGKIGAREINVLTGPWPDYVFEKNYNLPTLAEVENYINQHKHLPEVPAAKEMEENGVNLGEMNILLLKKVEELTLYLLEQNKMNQEQANEIEKLKHQLLTLQKK